MKKFIGLLVMFFVLSTSISSFGAKLVRHSLDKKVFVSGVDTPISNFVITAATFQTGEFGLVRCPSVSGNNIISTKNTIDQNYTPIKLERAAEVQNKNVIWLTNMKSK